MFFRAYNRETERMYWFDLMWGNFKQGGGYIGMVEIGLPRDTVGSHKGNVRLVDPEECEIMQYTGLRDRNRVEIYEGDIYRVFDKIGEDDNGEDIYKEYKYEVEYRTGICSIGFQFLSHHSNIEVIGNIYQTPELLHS